MKTFAKLLLPCLLALTCQSSVKADNGLAMAYLFGYGGNGGARMQSYVPSPPYFAMHPPVYYGERFTRPYGASPFAAWPQLQGNANYAPSRHVDRSQMIGNPYFGSSAEPVQAEIITRATVAEPIEIENPYYQADAVYTSAQ